MPTTLKPLSTLTPAEAIEFVPPDYYIDGSTRGGVIKQSKSVRYASRQTARGTFALERLYYDARGRPGWSTYSDAEYASPIEAALALKRGGVAFTRRWLSEPPAP